MIHTIKACFLRLLSGPYSSNSTDKRHRPRRAWSWNDFHHQIWYVLKHRLLLLLLLLFLFLLTHVFFFVVLSFLSPPSSASGTMDSNSRAYWLFEHLLCLLERKVSYKHVYVFVSVTNMGFEFYTRPQQGIVLPQTTTIHISILIGWEFQQHV